MRTCEWACRNATDCGQGGLDSVVACLLGVVTGWRGVSGTEWSSKVAGRRRAEGERNTCKV